MHHYRCCMILSVACICPVTTAQVASIDPVNRYSWAENIGWINWLPVDLPSDQQVRIASTYLSGYIWTENVGWIDLGHIPADGSSYSNSDGKDYGVNIGVGGELSGFAWCENIGWIVFDTSAALGPMMQEARIDFISNRFRGYLWAENVGWINLDDTEQYVGIIADCLADVNGDGAVTPTDFSAWISAFNSSLPGCDQNLDGLCTPTDFTAWITNFNLGC